MKIHRKRQPTAVWLSALFVVSTLCSAEQDSNGQGISIQPIYYRQPMGIYARYTAGCGSDECIKNEAYALVSVYGIAGIDAALGWKNLNPAEDTYVWTDPSAVNELQDIFDGVDEWNRENPTATPKTVQLDINAGFNAPQWVFNKLASCDPMFGYWTPGTLFTNPVYYQYSSP